MVTKLHRIADGGRSRSHTPDSVSSPNDMGLGNNGGMGSPPLHQKIRAIGGVPTPFTATTASPITQRSNPPTPTQTAGVRPEFIGLAQHAGVASVQYPHPRPHHIPPYYDSYNVPNGGEQRRILSEGELMYDRQYMMPHDQQSVGGPIRELESSPQRGVYMWKDNSPTGPAGNYFHSNPTSPIQHNLINNGGGGSNHSNRVYGNPGGMYVNSSQKYTPAGNQVPISPSAKNKMYDMGVASNVPNSSIMTDGIRPSPISRRPMSFVRALEMTDSLEMANRSKNSPAGTPTPKAPGQPHINDMSERSRSIYDTNYEISV